MDRSIRWTKWDKLSSDVDLRLREYLRVEPCPSVTNRFYEIEYLNKSLMAPVKWLCHILHVSRSGYYKWLHNRDNGIKRDAELLNDIIFVYNRCDGAAGYMRMTKQINVIRNKENRKPCSLYSVRRLTKKYGFYSLAYNYKRSQIKHKYIKTFNNYLDMNYNDCERNEFWSIDISEIKLKSGRKVYMCAVLDVKTRYVLAFSIHLTQTMRLPISTVKKALASHPGIRPRFLHSDNGMQFYSNEYKDLLKQNRIKQSASRSRNPYDNAIVESFFSCLKCEKIYIIDPPRDIIEARKIVERYVQYYNSYRVLHRFNMTPAELYYGY